MLETAADQPQCRAPGVDEKYSEGGRSHDAAAGDVVRRGAYDQGPVAALRRVAFLMERGREETRRVQAFRNAAATILPLPADEVASARRGRHAHRARGIGPSTAAVIESAVRGEVPERLAKLEREYAGPLTHGRARAPGGTARRPALALRLVRRRLADRGDGVHRDGAGTRVPRADRPLAPADRRQRPQPGRLTKQLGVVDAVNEHLGGGGFTLLKGIEVDILDDGGLDQTEELLAQLDVRVASVHSKLAMEPDR